MKIKHGLALMTTLACLLGTLTASYAFDSTVGSTKNTGIYIEGLAGYNRYALKNMANPKDSWRHGMGNWAFGGDLGYQFCKYFSAEGGGIYTLHGIAKNPRSLDPSKDETNKTWYAYLAGKMSVMIGDKATLFTKLGLGYQQLRVVNGPFGNEKFHKWGAMFAAGTAYHFTPAIYISLQWLRFTGKTTEGTTYAMAPNIFLLGIGYKF